ncbi:formate--tetrahydrofolate ligase [Microbacterium elymi]|uniref:formate--tetrahydrofolate ligase n=1 Tax=Microbacterium elymi TaxID=2909587 RepID=UPI00338FD563
MTEAGFGADLGGEKFVDILCRSTGLRPSLAVVVATVRSLKYQGGVDVADLPTEDVDALGRGVGNLERHLHIVRDILGLPAVVAINHRAEDSPAEIDALLAACERLGVTASVATHFADGGAGAEDLARKVVDACPPAPVEPTYTYPLATTLWDKMTAIASRVYGADGISADAGVRAQIQRLQDDGYGELPVCVAKTQYSFSTNPALLGAPDGHTVNVREVRLAAGARFIVMICGSIMTMPGLPARPAAASIDVDADGRITGLF